MSTRASFYSIIVVLGCCAYISGFAVEFMLDPLGRSPVLDANENLAWAGLIADGQLPDEPLYRALLYPWVLSLFHVEGALLAQFATLFGVFCHCVNALLVAVLAGRLWRQRAAAWFSGILYALYPVSMYFSVQVLDMTFAMTLFLTGLFCVVKGSESMSLRSQWGNHIAAGLLLGLSVLARPNFLLPLFCVPLAPFILQVDVKSQWRRSLLPLCILLVAMLLPLLGQGFYNYSESGDFRVLPWQGGYNLLTANKAEANGKYFKQSVRFDEIPSGKNPNRLESEYLYRSAMGSEVDLDVDAMNHHWRQELLRDIAGNPLRWFGLMGRKVVYLLNDWEQYNNLTYAYHKQRFSFLQYNPLGWGVLLIGAASGCWLFRASLNGRLLFFMGGVFALYAAGFLLFYASARFRLPLVPFLAIGCGGVTQLRVVQLTAMRGKLGVLLAVFLIGMGVLVYGDWFEARDRSSFIQDELLLASASARVMEDAAALKYAQAVLVRDPLRREAQMIQTTSLYNLWLTAESAKLRANYWQQLGVALDDTKEQDATMIFISGVYAWRSGEPDRALSVWRSGTDTFGTAAHSCAQALLLVCENNSASQQTSGLERLRAILGHIE